MKHTKFKKGQVVLMRMPSFQAFKIWRVYPAGTMLHKEPYYLFEGHGKNGSAQSNLRSLIKKEVGK